MSRKVSEEHRRKVSEARKRYFAEHPEAREALSRKLKERLAPPREEDMPEWWLRTRKGLERGSKLVKTSKYD